MSASSPQNSSFTEWGRRAAALYGDDYADRYRHADDEIRHGALVTRFGLWLSAICESLGRELVVLDLGCGTGRYFWAVRGVRELVGVDVSAPMLTHARHRAGVDATEIDKVTFVHGDLLMLDLGRDRFDLVYSIGVLGEHVPFDTQVARRAFGWLRQGGRFAFTAVHRESFSVPRTLKRRLAERLLAVAPAPLRSALRRRLISGGLYVDESYIAEVIRESNLVLESIERHESDVHLHCLCVARKVTT